MVLLISALATFLIFKYVILPFARQLSEADTDKNDDSLCSDDDDFSDLFN